MKKRQNWFQRVELICLMGCMISTVSGQAQSADAFNPGADNGINALAVQGDGKILVGGQFTSLGGQTRNYIGRLNPDGSLDSTFDPGADYTVYSLAVQADGKILVGGGFSNLGGQVRYSIGRLNVDGTVDAAFNPGASGAPVRTWVYSLKVQADGKIFVGGNFTTLAGQPCSSLGRLNVDGTLDAAFNANVGGGGVHTMAVQADGAIVLGGYFTSLDGQYCSGVGRIKVDGTLDSAFLGVAGGTVLCLAVQADGKILMGGGFTVLNDEARNYIGRLNTDGSLDTTFNPGASTTISSLALQADGRILVGGNFTSLGGQPRSHIGRLNADGSVDTTFNPGANSSVTALAPQADGKVLAGGAFSSLGGQTRNNIGRLNNTDAATQTLTFSGSTATWLRGGTSPEIYRTTFECSTDGVYWADLGAGIRVDGGWQLGGLSLPANVLIRARGYTAGGRDNGSTWFVETITGPETPPEILLGAGTCGFTDNKFGFNFNGPAGRSAVVETSTDLTSWTPLQTNVLDGTIQFFSDANTNAVPRRFYRLRIQ